MLYFLRLQTSNSFQTDLLHGRAPQWLLVRRFDGSATSQPRKYLEFDFGCSAAPSFVLPKPLSNDFVGSEKLRPSGSGPSSQIAWRYRPHRARRECRLDVRKFLKVAFWLLQHYRRIEAWWDRTRRQGMLQVRHQHYPKQLCYHSICIQSAHVTRCIMRGSVRSL